MIEITRVTVRCDNDCNAHAEEIDLIDPVSVLKGGLHYEERIRDGVKKQLPSWAIWDGEQLCPECSEKQ